MNLRDKILFVLKYEKESVTSSDFKVIPTYFYNTIGHLTKEGLIESIPNPDDIRKREYKLTALGKKEVKKVTGFFI